MKPETALDRLFREFPPDKDTDWQCPDCAAIDDEDADDDEEVPRVPKP